MRFGSIYSQIDNRSILRQNRFKLLSKMTSFLLKISISVVFLQGIVFADIVSSPRHITILHTNDHHGHFWPNEIGEYGLAAQKTVVDAIRRDVEKKGGVLLLLSAGDINTGVPESDLQRARPDIIGMNAIGYDAMAVGNHEFDNPFFVLKEQEIWAKFPFLSANIYIKGTDKRPFKPYEIFDKKGISVAVIGLITEETAFTAEKRYVKNFEFRDVKQELNSIVTELNEKEHKPDMVIALTHLGHYDRGSERPSTTGDVELAHSLPEGAISIIVGGHSQNPLCMGDNQQKIVNYIPGSPCIPDKQNGIWIVQAHEWGKYIGRADFELSDDGAITLQHYELIPINLKKEVTHSDGTKALTYYTKKIIPDAILTNLLKPYQEKGQKKLSVVVGKLEGYLEGKRDVIRHQQTNLGQLILQANMDAVSADLAVISSGVIRDSLIEGDITYRDILKILPFKNTVVSVDLTGKELINYLQAVYQQPKGSGGYPQFANVEFRGNKILIKHQEINLNKKYRLALVSYNGAGGDGYPILTSHRTYLDSGYVDAKVLVDYFKANKIIYSDNYQIDNQL